MTTDRVVALIGSPYQALGLLEYVRFAKVEGGLVFVNRLRDPAMMAPTFNTLAHLTGFRFQFRAPGGFGQPAETTADSARQLADIAQAEVPNATLVIGDYRETLGWRLARDLGCEGDRVVVLDDGAATLSIDRTEGGFAPLEWSSEAEAGGFLPMPEISFFTAFPELLRSSAKDTVLPNHWVWLKDRYRDLPRSSSVTLVIGQGLSRVGLVDDATELRLADELIQRARAWHPDAAPLYVAHRGESEAKLRTVSQWCDVVRFDIPVELVPIDGGALPSGIFGHYSTALTSFAELMPDGFPVHAVRVPDEALLDRHEYIAYVYDRLASGYDGAITVVD